MISPLSPLSLLLLLLIIIILYINNKKKIQSNKKNKWIVLLTMCVKQNKLEKKINSNEINDMIKYRIELYTEVINKWLTNTDLPIFVVESSNYNFKEIKHDRLKVFAFQGEPLANSSIAEAKSILYALEKLKDYNGDYTHILKVTGKYYLDGITQTLSLLPNDYDIYIQQHINYDLKHINTEYYGIKKDIYNDFANNCINNVIKMEPNMFKFRKNKKVIEFPRTFCNSNNIKRDDGSIIKNL